MSLNPKASTFVPKFLKKDSPPEQPKEEKPAEVQTKPANKEETWEDKAEEKPAPAPVKEEKKEAPKVTVIEDHSDPTWEPSEEQIQAELKRMEQEAALDQNVTEEVAKLEIVEDNREHINIVFIGHVDSGKSTISGQILYITGQVDMRTIQKYEREAKDKNRESWYLAYIMDTNEEERAKGKTVEVGRAHFETAAKRYTILDAPGHKNFVPNMIGGAAQADIGILVISAKKGEFESGFHKGGQTREHTMLAKTLGLRYLIVVINKMDDPTVGWEKSRYDECIRELTPFIKQVGYNVDRDVTFIPISGLKGYNLKDPIPEGMAPWYTGSTLLATLDNLKPLERLDAFPLRLPIMDKFKESGVVYVLGKVETGVLVKGQQLVIMPNKTPVIVGEIKIDETKQVKKANPGENVQVGLKGVEEENIHRGYVLCDAKIPIKCQARFEAQLAILELLPHKSIFSAGYSAVMHIHTAVEECNIIVLLEQLDKRTGATIKKKPNFVANGHLVRCIIECAQPINLELFSDVPQLGRFTLRDEGRTIAVGKVTALGPRKKPAEN